MWDWILTRAKLAGQWTAALGDPTIRTIEIRLFAYGAYVMVGLSLIVMAFYYSHKIDNVALTTMGAACALGTFSIPQQDPKA